MNIATTLLTPVFRIQEGYSSNYNNRSNRKYDYNKNRSKNERTWNCKDCCWRYRDINGDLICEDYDCPYYPKS